MDEGVGTTLAEARERHGLDLDQVAAETKIRARYLRAIEAEEWDALPGEAYARAFVRTYASYLGLDVEELSERQRRQRGEARPSERLPRVDARSARGARSEPRTRMPPRLLAVIVSVSLVAVLLAIGLLSGGGAGGGHTAPQAGGGAKAHRSGGGGVGKGGGAAQKPRPKGQTLSLVADAEVWVCLLGGGGKALVDGRILPPGASEGPFRSGSFTLSLGNGEVTMTLNGKQAQIPATSSPVGYSVSGGELHPLSEAERPTCT